MTIDRAIEILDPEHREQYDSLETVKEACRMGMEALRTLKEQNRASWIPCRDCKYWDEQSGLTARKCGKHGIITKQSDWCSYAKGR